MASIAVTIAQRFRALLVELFEQERNVRDYDVLDATCELLHKLSAMVEDAVRRDPVGNDPNVLHIDLQTVLSALLSEFDASFDTTVEWMRGRNVQLQRAAVRFLAACSSMVNAPPLHFFEDSFNTPEFVETVVNLTQSTDIVLAAYAGTLLSIDQIETDHIRWVVRTPTPTQAIARVVQCYEYFQQHADALAQYAPPEQTDDTVAYEAAISDPAWYKPLDPADEPAFSVELAERSLELLAQFGEYQEMVVPFVDADILRIAASFADSKFIGVRRRAAELIGRAVAHKKFAHQFVEEGGISLFIRHKQHQLSKVTIWYLSVALYRIACVPSAMELVLALDDNTVADFFQCTIELLRHTNALTQRFIILFFSMAIAFPKVLDYFDGQLGLCTVTQAMVDPIPPQVARAMRDIRPHSEACAGFVWQYSKIHFARTMQAYLNRLRETNSIATASEITRAFSHLNLEAEIRNAAPSNPLKPIRAESEDIIRWTQIVHHVIATEGRFPGLDDHWRPFFLVGDEAMRRECFTALTSDDSRYGSDCVIYILSALELLCVVPEAVRAIAEAPVADNASGIDVCLNIVLGSGTRDPNLLEQGLSLLRALVLPPDYDPHRPAAVQPPSRKPAETDASALQNVVVDQDSDMQKQQQVVRRSIRARNGIRGLVDLLQYRRNILFVDTVRLVTAQVLLGLAEDPEICRIFEKLRLSKILSDLVRAGPVSEQALMRHQAFREYTLVLISKVSGKAEAGFATNDAMDPVTVRLEKAAIVAGTTLAYDQQQLLGLIRDHLVSLGLDRSAAMLTSEANLPSYSKLSSTSGPSSAIRLSRHYDSPSSHAIAATAATATPIKSSVQQQQQQQPGTKRRRQSRTSSVGLHAIEELMRSPDPAARQATSSSSNTGNRSKRTRKGSRCESPALSEASSSSSAKPATRRMTRLLAAREASLAAAQATPSAAALKRAAWRAPSYFDAKPQDSTPSAARTLSSSRRAFSSSAGVAGESLPATQRASRGRPKSPAMSFHHAKSLQHRPHDHTLHSIVLSFLRSQHAQCSHPVSVLPPLDLVREHRCPAPPVPSNSIADALEARRLAFGTRHVDIDRTVSRYIHARLRYWRHYKEPGSMLTACAFGHDKRKLYLSNHMGQLITFDPWTLQSEGPWDVGSVASIVTSRRADIPIMMTCSFTSQYALFDPEIVCRVWREGQFMSPTWEIGEMFKPSFNSSVTKACGFQYNPGSLEHSPVILDLASGVLTVLEDQLVARHASFDRPTCVFDANDELLLASGNLWDLRTNSIVHRFDRLTKAGDGTFHPNGNEVLIDGNIWDVRTHRLLRTMPLLDKSIVRFNDAGDVIYAFQPPPMNITSRRLNTTDQALSIIDAVDYTEVQSIHTDGTVMHQFDVDPSDQYLALIDCTFGQPPDSVCKIFEIGRTRPDDGDSDIDDGQSDDEEWRAEDHSQSEQDEGAMLGFGDEDDEEDDDDIDDELDELDGEDEIDFDEDDEIVFVPVVGGDDDGSGSDLGSEDDDEEEDEDEDDDEDDDDDDDDSWTPSR